MAVAQGLSQAAYRAMFSTSNLQVDLSARLNFEASRVASLPIGSRHDWACLNEISCGGRPVNPVVDILSIARNNQITVALLTAAATIDGGSAAAGATAWTDYANRPALTILGI